MESRGGAVAAHPGRPRFNVQRSGQDTRTLVSRRISLALTLHNHQPVGNFGWVIAETFDHAYLPMLEALEHHPSVRLALHYSGPLLAWIRAERPDFVERLAALVARRQVEIVGGGWYEPVLAALPERDRIGQLERMADELEDLFGTRPRGAWLAERVWEPDLPTSLVTAGYTWTVLDDAHFRAAAIPEEALWGPYTTDDQGKVLTVFGTEQGLRYRIPFFDVEEVIGYLRDHATEAGDRVGTMGDDGEKFGGWPTTFEVRGSWSGSPASSRWSHGPMVCSMWLRSRPTQPRGRPACCSKSPPRFARNWRRERTHRGSALCYARRPFRGEGLCSLFAPKGPTSVAQGGSPVRILMPDDEPYLTRLTSRLLEGIERLPAAAARYPRVHGADRRTRPSQARARRVAAPGQIAAIE
jgi:hypothetical protein